MDGKQFYIIISRVHNDFFAFVSFSVNLIFFHMCASGSSVGALQCRKPEDELTTKSTFGANCRRVTLNFSNSFI